MLELQIENTKLKLQILQLQSQLMNIEGERLVATLSRLEKEPESVPEEETE